MSKNSSRASVLILQIIYFFDGLSNCSLIYTHWFAVGRRKIASLRDFNLLRRFVSTRIQAVFPRRNTNRKQIIINQFITQLCMHREACHVSISLFCFSFYEN